MGDTMRLCIKCADLGHSCKPWATHLIWSKSVMKVTSRSIIIKLILDTDMQHHFDFVGSFKVRIEGNRNLDLTSVENRLDTMRLCIKCADLGHSCKPWACPSRP